jgi:hypothetical protein
MTDMSTSNPLITCPECFDETVVTIDKEIRSFERCHPDDPQEYEYVTRCEYRDSIKDAPFPDPDEPAMCSSCGHKAKFEDFI